MTPSLERNPRIAELVDAIDRLRDLVEREAPTAERLNRPTQAVQDALRATGVFRMLVSEELGGYGASPTETLEIIEHVSYLDPSLGWLVRVITSETATVTGALPAEVVEELRGSSGAILVAGQSGLRSGTAVREEGGYRISGTWRYAPGLAMATHVVLSAALEDTDETIIAVVGRDQLSILDEWNALGLRASASFNYSAKDVFVPERFVFQPDAPLSYASGLGATLAPALTSGLNQGAWAQGVGRRMLDELRELSLERLEAGEDELVSDEFYAEYARHYSHVQGTMALLRTTWQNNEDTLRRGEALSNEQETMTRLAASLSTRTVLEIAQLVHRFAGAHVVRNGTLQRLFRDAHAGTQHRATGHVVAQECGRMLIGALPEGSHWGQFDLVIPQAS